MADVVPDIPLGYKERWDAMVRRLISLVGEMAEFADEFADESVKPFTISVHGGKFIVKIEPLEEHDETGSGIYQFRSDG